MVIESNSEEISGNKDTKDDNIVHDPTNLLDTPEKLSQRIIRNNRNMRISMHK